MNQAVTKQIVQFKDIGLIDYQQCWNYQEELMQQLIKVKLSNRELTEDEKTIQQHYLLFCEHPHVYTLGKSGHESNLLVDQEGLQKAEATFYKINRGGDITYHGPGQIVGYPILDLDLFLTTFISTCVISKRLLLKPLRIIILKVAALKALPVFGLVPARPMHVKFAHLVCAFHVGLPCMDLHLTSIAI